MIPGLLYFILFRYAPMGGLVIAFKDYSIFKGMWESDWVGLENFRDIFTSLDFWQILRNTLVISLLKLSFGFPVPIFLALLLNELTSQSFKRIVQALLYIPYFIAWTIVGTMMLSVLSPNWGFIPTIIESLVGERPNLLTNGGSFITILIVSDIWKHAGWGTIIYLAAFTQIDPNLYEAAIVDGANRWQQIFRITIPSILGIIIMLLIIRIGWIMHAGFEQILVLQNPVVRDVSEIFDTYVFRVGLGRGEYSFTATVDFFKSLVGLILIVLADRLSKMVGEEGLL
jgi:putative aldouronate transport system permease protein